jgi:hypothetical protein
VIDHTATHLALRAHAFACVIATTGTMSLAATTTGYTRASGSFLSDGFAVGMEVTPTGFPQTATGVITALTATTMTVKGGRTAATAAGSRALAANLPSRRGFENIAITPVVDEPYVTEEYLPGGGPQKRGLGAYGFLELTPTYVLNLYAPQDKGIGALRKSIDALIAHFAPTTSIAVGSDYALVRADLGPFPTPIRQLEDGWAACSLSVPIRLTTANSR